MTMLQAGKATNWIDTPEAGVVGRAALWAEFVRQRCYLLRWIGHW
ncbi:hypothetical protein ACVWXO_009041 [Bradyrhizobium sp. LM2.7]